MIHLPFEPRFEASYWSLRMFGGNSAWRLRLSGLIHTPQRNDLSDLQVRQTSTAGRVEPDLNPIPYQPILVRNHHEACPPRVSSASQPSLDFGLWKVEQNFQVEYSGLVVYGFFFGSSWQGPNSSGKPLPLPLVSRWQYPVCEMRVHVSWRSCHAQLEKKFAPRRSG